MAVYEYEDKTDPNLSTLHTSIGGDTQLDSHEDQGGEGHHTLCRWDEGTPESGIGTLRLEWSGDLCATCETALDALAAAV
jgi:hypothetical protein